MKLPALVGLASLTSSSAQFLSSGSATKNACGDALVVPANASGVQQGQDTYNNGLGHWKVAVSTNSSAATIENGGHLTEESPGAVANVWLDPFQDIHLTDGNNGYSACAYIFKGLPENTIRRGQDDDGSCTQMLSKACIDAINHRAAQSAMWLVANPTQGPYSNLTPPILVPICQDIVNGIGYGPNALSNPFPSECAPYFDNGEPQYPTTDVLVLTSNVTGPRNCTFYNSEDHGGSIDVEGYNVPPGLRYPFNSTNHSASASYDELVQQVWPILTVTMPPANNSREAMVGNAEASMTCIRAKNVKAGSRVPAALPAATAVHFPGQLSGGDIAGIVIGSIVGVAIIAGAVWWVWRRHRRQKQTQKLQDQREPDQRGVTTTESDTKEVHQMDVKEKPVQLDSSQRVELGGGDLPRSELAGGPLPPQELPGSTPVSTSTTAQR